MRNDFREDHSSTSEALICITITKMSKLKSSILSRKVYNRVRNLVIEKGHWKLKNVVCTTNTKETTNNHYQG
ncbi:MAG: hypothetical protein BWX81_00167 [Spirochaetes bacterium ADurb.Bin110]|jgi:hypothetical protein|nr:MAG: hypothetical protein BWX81_00167 [Spirochaetes bacterium ADurb.Bin110]